MAVQIASLNSGSNGNCYYIGNGTDAVLVDAGISCRETERRLKSLDLHTSRIRAIFISHEHSDHISGLRVLSAKYQLPVYITEATQRGCPAGINPTLVNRFATGEPVKLGSLSIFPFRKEHDANDPHSFVVESGSVRIGVFTDIGTSCERVVEQFRRCHAVFLESNYDPQMLKNGSYPYVLKKRISGGNGHLSNEEALELYLQHRSRFLSHLILSHLSQQNNTPEIVEKLFQPHGSGRTIFVASRYEPSPLFEVNGNLVFPDSPRKSRSSPASGQLSLF